MKPNSLNQKNQPCSGAPGAYRRPGNSPRGKTSRKRSRKSSLLAQDKRRRGGGSSTTSRQLPELSKVIVPVHYPANLFTIEQLNKLQTDIIKEIDKIPSGNFMPQFLSCIQDQGVLKLNCKNSLTSQWLETTIPTLEDWQKVEVMTCDPKDIPARSTLQIWIPGPVKEPDQILKRLERQNEGLNTQDWLFLEKEMERGYEKLFVSVKDADLDPLKKIDFNPFLNLTRVKIERLGTFTPRRNKDEPPETAYIDWLKEQIEQFQSIARKSCE